MAQRRTQVISLEHWASNIGTQERYQSQTKLDYTAPSTLPQRDPVPKLGGTVIVLGYETTPCYATETQEQFTAKLGSTRSPAKGPAGDRTSDFGTKDCIHNSLHQLEPGSKPFETEQGKFSWASESKSAHRAGLAAIETCRLTSLQLNQTRIMLGDSPAEYVSSAEAALAGAVSARVASGEELVVPRRRPLADAAAPVQTNTAGGCDAALVPGRLVEIGSGGPPEPSSYETTYKAATQQSNVRRALGP